MDTLFPGLFNAPNIHPLFVHFPIVLWAVATLFLVIGAARRRDDVTACGRWLLYLGAASSIVGLITGYVATDSMDHGAPGHEFIHDHKNYMIAATVMGVVTAVAAFALRWRAESVERQRIGRWIVVGFAVATMATTMLGADRGANLVFEHGIGTPGATEAAHTSSTRAH